MTPRPRPPVRSVLHRAAALLALALVVSAGCSADPAAPEIVWGKHGVQDGDFVKPRAIAIDAQDRLYIVDYTARIQVYDRDGNYLGPTWTTPDYRNGRPSGLSIDRDGNLLVSDSHYHCLRIYTPDGQELRKIGGEAGSGPGQLSLRQRRRAGRRRQFLRRGVRRELPHHQARCRRPFRAMLGHRRHGAGPVLPRRALALGPTATSMSPTPATTASRSSPATATWCASGARRARSRGNCRILTIWRSAATAICTLSSTATTACRSSRRKGIARLLGRPGPRAGQAASALGLGRGQPRPGPCGGQREPSGAAHRVLRRLRRSNGKATMDRLLHFLAPRWFAVFLLGVALLLAFGFLCCTGGAAAGHCRLAVCAGIVLALAGLGGLALPVEYGMWISRWRRWLPLRHGLCWSDRHQPVVGAGGLDRRRLRHSARPRRLVQSGGDRRRLTDWSPDAGDRRSGPSLVAAAARAGAAHHLVSFRSLAGLGSFRRWLAIGLRCLVIVLPDPGPGRSAAPAAQRYASPCCSWWTAR